MLIRIGQDVSRLGKSTTGCCVVHGGHLIRSFSKTQSNIALSSAEAELYAMVSAASEGLGARAMVADYGGEVQVTLFVDASAAIGVAQRKGLGKIRHLDTQALWIQDAVRQRKIELQKVKGTQNPADLMTKCLGSSEIADMMNRFGLQSWTGRPELARQVAKDDGWQQEGTGLEDESLDAVEINCLDSLDACSDFPMVSGGATGRMC